ncbi:MAG: hypothetical protein KDD22_05600, partial [Bdellovibrionales bacterium]|nr:hypothetical protein [Bdellovibrionales bacterium]
MNLRIAGLLLTFLFFSGLSFLYLSPAGSLLLENNTEQALSSGTDSVTLPFLYQLLDHLALTHPSQIFYGALPNPNINAPDGLAAWVPWSERIFSLGLSPFLSPEQRATGIIFILWTLNAFIFFMWARSLGWSWGISMALAICWAFNPFTRARAHVHTIMAGIYFLPLSFLGLRWAITKTSRSSLLWAALCLLFASFSAHYFLIISLGFLPFFLIYLGKG